MSSFSSTQSKKDLSMSWYVIGLGKGVPLSRIIFDYFLLLSFPIDLSLSFNLSMYGFGCIIVIITLFYALNSLVSTGYA